MRDLSGDIAPKPGKLRIEFYGAEDLAAMLLELSKARANDWPAFARVVEEETAGSPSTLPPGRKPPNVLITESRKSQRNSGQSPAED